MNPETLDQAFEALKTYDWGADRNALNPIGETVLATRENAEARGALETRLAAVLATDVSRDAKDVVCRWLMVVGTAACVPALAALLTDEQLAHMARYALERIPDPAAAQALREAIDRTGGNLRVGIIGSLGARQDAASVPGLVTLLGNDDAAVACSAIAALAVIRTPEAVQALTQAQPASPAAKCAVVDALLACAEKLLAHGKRAEAMAVYRKFAGDEQPIHVRLAATQGLLACAGQTP
jgi:HEAT repeat protein